MERKNQKGKMDRRDRIKEREKKNEQKSEGKTSLYLFKVREGKKRWE